MNRRHGCDIVMPLRSVGFYQGLIMCFRVDSDGNGQITAYELGKALSNGKFDQIGKCNCESCYCCCCAAGQWKPVDILESHKVIE